MNGVSGPSGGREGRSALASTIAQAAEQVLRLLQHRGIIHIILHIIKRVSGHIILRRNWDEWGQRTKRRLRRPFGVDCC